jgi:hypothetical protein
VRLVRCLELTSDEHENQRGWNSTVDQLVQQTIAFAEDQLGQKVTRGLLCGFEEEPVWIREQMERQFGFPFSQVESKFGTALPGNTGMFGLLEQFTE